MKGQLLVKSGYQARRKLFVLIILTSLIYSVQSDTECNDISPGGSQNSLSCIQQAQWGKCNRRWLYQWGYCRRTCGQCTPPQDDPLECTDVPPDSYYTCPQQAAFGKCDAVWMQPHHCRLSCGKCTQSDACIDIPPDNKYTCADQKQFGQCDSKWLIDRNFCRRTCGKCPLQQIVDKESGNLSASGFPVPRTVNEFILISNGDAEDMDPNTIPGIITSTPTPSPTTTPTPSPSKKSQKCSIMDALQNNPNLTEQNPTAYDVFKQALDSKEISLQKYLNKKGLEGVVLVPSERTLSMYLPVLTLDQLVEVIQYYVIPYDLNEFTIGPYEYSLQGSSVRLIRDEFVENEFATSSATVVDIISLMDDKDCQQDLEFWTINGLLVPPLFKKPEPILPSPIIQSPYQGGNAFRASSAIGQIQQDGVGVGAGDSSGLGLLLEDTGGYQNEQFPFLMEDITPQQSASISTSQTPQQIEEQQSMLNSILAMDQSYSYPTYNYYDYYNPIQSLPQQQQQQQSVFLPTLLPDYYPYPYSQSSSLFNPDPTPTPTNTSTPSSSLSFADSSQQ